MLNPVNIAARLDSHYGNQVDPEVHDRMLADIDEWIRAERARRGWFLIAGARVTYDRELESVRVRRNDGTLIDTQLDVVHDDECSGVCVGDGTEGLTDAEHDAICRELVSRNVGETFSPRREP